LKILKTPKWNYSVVYENTVVLPSICTTVFTADSFLYMADPRLSADSQPLASHRQHVPPGEWLQ